ncbi:hypothetical protein BDW68DRAFT_167989 [Aspergillus falconensis]
MDRYITAKANGRSARIFKAKPNRTQLQLQTIERVRDGAKCAFRLGPRKQINQVGELEEVCRV